jgi:valyl-tRNA synthetase
MDKTYDSKAVEAKWYRFWTERGLFHGAPGAGGEPYCIVIPPPNVTGILHMGHALNNIIQDILVRWRRMQGRNAMWMPGTDHAGIATQNVVERALRQEGKSRADLGREAFVERVWEWRRQYGGTIINQLKRLGCSCDWARERFTMDEGLSDAVAEVFIRLYEKGLIYRANYIINWCPRCHTALSDEESEHRDTRGKLYYIRYPVEGGAGGHVTVATTRPETLLGDTAVAVNPRDERYRDLPGRQVKLPILNRELAVIQDEFVDPKFGTGIVKVTPAHDPNDFAMGQRHGLPSVNVMNGDGTMNEEAGPYRGMDRFACRERILRDLQEQGLIEKIEEHAHAVGHCYRCDTVVEPRLSLQWFVKMKPLAAPAIEAVKAGRVQFVPARWTKVYLDWMENIRDWCISRQIWWGHRVPVFTCEACGHVWAAKGRPSACPACGGGQASQDDDVLDTWFSSWLWPFSTLGWPARNTDLSFYYPTHDLVTASEIIFFWVARMIMAGLECMGDVPFRTVYIHGTVRDNEGRKMSKSLGNSVDPLGVIDEFSADALRFSLMMITATGQDVYVSTEKFEIGRNFGTKIWNAARFLGMQTAEREADAGVPREAQGWCRAGKAPAFDPALLGPDDRHILARLQEAIRGCTENLERYRFNDAAHALHEFVWHQYCDWYVEYSKDVLYGQDAARRAQVLRLMHYVFSTVLRLIHPFMPFISEELWHTMGYGEEADSIMTAPWPRPAEAGVLDAWRIDADGVQYVDDKHELIRIGRMLKLDYGIPPSRKVAYLVKPHAPAGADRLNADLEAIRSSLRAESLTIDPALAPARAMPSGIGRIGTVYMPVEGLIDAAAETRRLSGELAKVAKELDRVNGKLANLDFINKARPEVVEQQRQKKQELLDKSEKLRRLIAGLAGP